MTIFFRCSGGKAARTTEVNGCFRVSPVNNTMGVIDEIKERVDIVDLIQSSGVNLRRTGRSWLGFCPFHSNTRTPAFTVYPDSQSFYCFGCQASGTAFDFVMRKQGLDFRGALEQLAARAGVQLKERSAEEQQEDAQRTRLLEICAAAAVYFNAVLLNQPGGQTGREYIEQRGINPEMVEAFQLGYSLDEWSRLLRYLTDRRGYDPAEIEAAGLAIHHESRGYYDRFRGRLMFPIRDARGRVIGFGGRAIGDVQPKYMNTPQTLLFDKSHVLYGLDQARDAIRSADATVVVEGYVDVITAHQHGFKNVVAPLGTALTQGHVALLKRLSPNVSLALDADAAGQRATLRGLNVLQEGVAAEEASPVTTAQGLVRWQSDVNLRIITMPVGRDPDEVIRADPAEWQRLLDHASPVMDFYINAYTAGLDPAQPQDQRAALDRLLPLLARLDATQQRVYIARLEQVIGIRAELILDLLRGNTQSATRERRSRRDQRPTPPAEPPHPAAAGAAKLSREDHLLVVLLRYPNLAVDVSAAMAANLAGFPALQGLLAGEISVLLENPANREIWRLRQATPNAELQTWAAELDPLLREQAQRLLAGAGPLQHQYRYRNEAMECMQHLRLTQIRTWIRRLSLQFATVETDREREEIATLLRTVQDYQRLVGTPRRSSSFPDMRDTLGHKLE
jgi:DNA primase